MLYVSGIKPWIANNYWNLFSLERDKRVVVHDVDIVRLPVMFVEKVVYLHFIHNSVCDHLPIRFMLILYIGFLRSL